MIDLALLEARAEMLARADDAGAVRYVREAGALPGVFSGAFGSYTVADITDAGNARFDFANDGEGLRAFLIEAFDTDGETVADLVAWSVDRPEHVLSMFGRVGLMGLAEAMAPSTYTCGFPLDVHRTPLDWLRAGCRGAAVVVPQLAARVLLEAPAIAGRDDIHTRQIADLARGAVPRFNPNKFFSASQPRKAA